MDEEIRWYKAPPSHGGDRALELRRSGKDFHGGYAFMSQGPLPIGWAQTLAVKRGCGA